MRFLRPLLLTAVGLAAGLGVLMAVLFSSTFQTWAVRRALAARPEFRAAIGAVSAGLNRVTLRDLRFEHAGAVITVPALEVDVPLIVAAVDRRFDVSRLLACGWTVDLARTKAAQADRASGPPGSRPVPGAVVPPAGRPLPGPAMAANPVTPAFVGAFAQLLLPFRISLDGVELEGGVVLPELRGRTKVSISGGGFGAGREGKFDVVLDAALTDPRVNAVGVRATLRGGMDGPQSFAQIALQFAATAKGTQFPSGVELAGEVSAARVANGESYAVTVVTHGREVVNLQVEFPRDATRLSGKWKVNMQDADLTPFALGLPLPVFTASGGGTVDADTGLAAIHASGQLAATANHLEVIRPEFAALGEIRIDADFDLAQRSGVFAVERLVATLGAAQPVATVRALQSFEFNPATGDLRTKDATRELVGISLHGVPVAWARPFLTQVDVTGDTLQGEWVGMARGGGLWLRSTAPITLRGLAVARGRERLVDRLDVSFGAAIDYTPRGWQTEIEALTVQRDGASVLTLEARAGRLTGDDQTLKTTGKITANLPAVLALPVAAGVGVLTGGEAVAEFAASLGTTQAVHAKIELKNLATMVESKATKLPSFSADIRADLAADGRIGFSTPIVIEANAQKSDVALSGSFVPVKGRAGTIVATVTSNQLVVEDLRTLAAVRSAAARQGPPEAGPTEPARPAAPPWAGLDGSITLQLRQVVYSDTFRANNVSGRLVLEAGKVRLESVQAGLGESGRANLNGVLTFEAVRPQPFALVADVALKEFDPGPLFLAMNRGQPATVEGKFDISSKLSCQAGSLGGLAAGTTGEFQLTSKGGVFRGLPASVNHAVGNTGRVAGLIAAAGNVLSGLTGKKEYAAVSSKAQAVSEFASGLNPIAFDQLSVVVERDGALNATLRDFTLIAPEVRLTGGGTVLHKAGSTLLKDSLAMEFKLRARGRQGELLKYLGALEPTVDELGYSACTLPIRVGGTIGQPDTSELNGSLVALALEKSGVTEKASELFNKLIGGGK